VIAFLLLFAIFINAAVFIVFELVLDTDSVTPYWNIGIAIGIAVLGWILAKMGRL
jgi:hypothetical protein